MTRSAMDEVEPCARYRVYDDIEDALYIGHAQNPFARLATHMNSAQGRNWTHDIATIKIDWYPTRRDALRAEREATLAESPFYSKQGVTIPWPEIKDAPARSPAPVPVPTAEPPPPESLPPSDAMTPAGRIVMILGRMNQREPTRREQGWTASEIARRATSTINPKRARLGVHADLVAAVHTLADDPTSGVTAYEVASNYGRARFRYTYAPPTERTYPMTTEPAESNA